MNLPHKQDSADRGYLLVMLLGGALLFGHRFTFRYLPGLGLFLTTVGALLLLWAFLVHRAESWKKFNAKTGLGEDDSDEGDADLQASKEVRETLGVGIFMFVILAAVLAVFGKSAVSDDLDCALIVGSALLYCSVAPFYYQFRFRTIAIHGKVSAIEKSVAAIKDNQVELLEELATIKDHLDAAERQHRL